MTTAEEQSTKLFDEIQQGDEDFTEEDAVFSRGEDRLQGLVYIMTNPAMPGFVKIGITRNLTARLSSLDNTSVPLPFRVAHASLVEDPILVERSLHAAFGFCRVRSTREFFEIDPSYPRHMLKLVELEDQTPSDVDGEVFSPNSSVIEAMCDCSSISTPKHIQRVAINVGMNEVRSTQLSLKISARLKERFVEVCQSERRPYGDMIDHLMQRFYDDRPNVDHLMSSSIERLDLDADTQLSIKATEDVVSGFKQLCTDERRTYSVMLFALLEAFNG